ncbi:MAG: PAS domain-containing protein [Oscillospiraceae bacterium]|nr:PAS domain-containing protein [Oscillospiraceae bacterium]
MLDFQLKIYLGLYDKAVEKAVRDMNMPEGVQAEIALFADCKNTIPENITAVFITDKISLLRSAFALRKKNLRVVYCGHAEDAGKSVNKLEALWPAGESIEIIKKRFMILIKNLKNEFYAWFYQNALLTTVNSLPDMLWYKRTDGIHVLVNDMFTETVHKPKSEIHGKEHFQIWNLPCNTEAEETAVRTGKTCICEETLRTDDGIKQFMTYQTPVCDMYGNVFGTVGIGRDITDCVQFSDFIENWPFPLVIFSPDWKVIRISRAFAEISGISRQETENFHYQDWKKENLIPVNSENDYRIEKNGEIKYFTIREQEIRNASGKISGYFLTMQDITCQKVMTAE